MQDCLLGFGKHYLDEESHPEALPVGLVLEHATPAASIFPGGSIYSDLLAHLIEFFTGILQCLFVVGCSSMQTLDNLPRLVPSVSCEHCSK